MLSSPDVNRLIELLLGLPRGFWGRDGEVSIHFNPVWPWQDTVGAAGWNLALLLALGALVVWVYRRDGRNRRARIILGCLRGALVGLLLLLLNRPVVTLTQNRVEPSVVAVLLDDSLSMKVRDVPESHGAPPTSRPADVPTVSRLDAVKRALASGVAADLLRDHQLRFFRFDADAQLVASMDDPRSPALPDGVTKVEALGQSTNVGASAVRAVTELAGQRLAGVVIFTDGRDSPARPLTEAINRLREAGVKVYTVETGSDAAPKDLAIQNVIVQESAFKGDLVNVRVTVRATGYPKGTRATLRLTDRRTGALLPGLGQPAEKQVVLNGDEPLDIDLPIKPDEVGELQLVATVTAAGGQSGQVDDADNSRQARLTVVDAKVNVLYVEGYPRWGYRLLRTELLRDKSVQVSILLTSADNSFVQDGDIPIRRFPESMEELLPYDVVIIGDVDPRQFTDAQLQLVADFVGKKGGGLAMEAGPRYAPARYRGSPLEPVLPVNISRVVADEPVADISIGFRPTVTPAGAATGIFRFLPDEAANNNYLKNDWQPIFWYLHGLAVKPGAGEALAEHPTDLGPDGKKAPILVAGRYGAGRTLFSATDDSWRWRYYTGESVFDTYWVQQIRLLARNRKLGQRLYTLASSRSTYELGDDVAISARVLEANLLKSLPDRIDADVLGEDGLVSRKLTLSRQDDRPDTYAATWRADKLGRETVKIGDLGPGATGTSLAIETVAPKLELADPRTDRAALERLATETHGQALTLAEASKLPAMIPSAAKVIPTESSRPLWDSPLAMAAFILLITAEWILRKIYGMV